MPYEALYLHIPFCKSKCLYCDFDSRADAACLDGMAAYLDALEMQVRAHGNAGELDDVKTVYIGGGTPSLAGERLIGLVCSILAFCTPVEFTCEANPESFSAGLACLLARAGVTRVSLGVQSLVDCELSSIGRIHSAVDALEAVQRARGAGLTVSCDLMCGLPGQTLASWERTLGMLLDSEVRPDHISVYPLQLEEGTPLERMERAGTVRVPDEDFQAECMDRAADLMRFAGYARYEVASYALPGCECLHNIAYWTGKSYLGLGRSAASMRDEGDSGRERFVQLDDGGIEFDRESLSPREAVAEDLMLSCRMVRGISVELLDHASRYIPVDLIDAACSRAVDLGLARWSHGALVPTHAGWLEGNELFGLFWNLARPA